MAPGLESSKLEVLKVWRVLQLRVKGGLSLPGPIDEICAAIKLGFAS